MSQAVQSAQQSLQQAGQQSARGRQGEASESEMGREFRAGSGRQQAGGQESGESASGSSGTSGGIGGGMGGPGLGAGGRAGPQQPLPGPKKDTLVKGKVSPRGQQLSRSYMGTPDPAQDRAAYYSLVPEKVRAQEATLNREEIPTAYKAEVRKYFDAISPR